MPDGLSIRRGSRGGVARHKSKDRGPLREFLAFVLGGQVYGVEISQVGSILKLPPLTPVPRAPEGVMGIISVRGKVVTVIDLRARLHLPSPPQATRARVLLLPLDDGETVGLFVEEVLQVYRLGQDEIEPPSSALGAEPGEHVIGLGRPDGNLIVLMDVVPILRR